MPKTTEEVKARLDIVDIIGTYVALKRAGANFKALCPFHSEKTPSFMVSKPKQMWYCFGCSEGGDIFKFVMKIEGLDFPETLKLLADKAGVELPRYDPAAQTLRNKLLEIMKAAADFYAAQLGTSKGAIAYDYLTRRGLSDAVIKQFSLGYAPDSWDALTLAFRDRFKAEDVFAAGILVRSERTQGFYDRFRHRIMFPVRDVHGATVGFTSRLLDEGRAEGKYVNTPETVIYNKSRVLYGLDLARQAIRQGDHAVIVEGNMDVIACHQFGMANVVASSGTALTIDQVRLLKRYTSNLAIAFDADPAGESAAKRGIDIALQEGMRVKVIVIPAGCGKDPDECLRKDLKAWEGAARGARDIMEYYLERARGRYDLSNAQGRSQFANALLTEIAKLPDLIEQDFWIKKVGEALRVDEKLLREQMRKLRMQNDEVGMRNARKDEFPNDHSALSIPHSTLSRPRAELLSERLLALFLIAPSYAEQIIAAVLPDMLSPKPHQDLYGKLVACYTAYTTNGPDPASGADFRQFWRKWALMTIGTPEILSTADVLELLADKEFEGWDGASLVREVQFLIDELRREHSKRRRFELAAKMREAEKEENGARVEELAREFEALTAGE